jgi:hypothetical protein
MKLINILENLLRNNFQPCISKGQDFENYFETLLINSGYESLNIDISKESKNKLLSCDDIFENKTGLTGYIREPFGSQSFPDFLLLEQNYIFSLELKSSQNTDKPMWNNSLPKQHGIYIFMAHSDQPSRQETLLFLGRDVITAHATNVLKSKMKAVQEASKFTKEELAILDVFNYGWEPYVRANYQQSIHNSSTIPSFVNNLNKDRNNRNVIEYLKQLR